MRNFKLVIEYEGSNYQGWQIQNYKLKTKTVQGEIEKALRKLFRKRIYLISSGRTDSGVHALGQVANFKCETSLKPNEIRNALNSHLPSDIRILRVEEVDLDFHARYSAHSKVYRYFILNRNVPSAIYRNYSWWIKDKLNLYKMHKASRFLLGKHNFRAFATHDPKRRSENFIRTIKRLSLKKVKDFIIFEIEADGFLYNMVRRIIGTLVDVGKGKICPEEIKKILSSHSKQIGPTAPPQGLFLVKVNY